MKTDVLRELKVRNETHRLPDDANSKHSYGIYNVRQCIQSATHWV